MSEAANTGSENADAVEAVRALGWRCPGCGGSLTAATSLRCPGCGEALVVSVGAAESKVRWWLAMVVPLLLAAGVGVVMILNVMSSGRLPVGKEAWVIWGLMGCVPVAFLAVVGRRRFYRWPWGVRVGLAVLSSGVFVTLFAMIAALVR